MDKKVSNSGPYDSVQNWIKNKTFQVQVWKMPQGQIHFLLLSKDVLKSENQFLSIFFEIIPGFISDNDFTLGWSDNASVRLKNMSHPRSIELRLWKIKIFGNIIECYYERTSVQFWNPP